MIFPCLANILIDNAPLNKVIPSYLMNKEAPLMTQTPIKLAFFAPIMSGLRSAGSAIAGAANATPVIGHGLRGTKAVLGNRFLGNDPMETAFNMYAGYQGAREGYDVGGVGGALAGGAGGFAGSRMLMGGVRVGAGRLTSGLRDYVGRNPTGFRGMLQSGRFQNMRGGITQRIGQGMENLGMQRAGQWVANQGANAMAAGQKAMASGQLNKAILPGASMAGFIGFGGLSDQIKQTTMDTYKHTLGNINQGAEQRAHDINSMRMGSPDAQTVPAQALQYQVPTGTNTFQNQQAFQPNADMNQDLYTGVPQNAQQY